MAIRNIVKDTDGYDTLHKKCRPVTDFNQKLWDLLDDMAQTMYKAQGVGLAGPQVGMLRRVFVIDVGRESWSLSTRRFWKPPARRREQKAAFLFPGNTAWWKRPNHVKGARTEPHGRMV